MQTFKEPLSLSEEKYYFHKLKEGDKEARDVLIERNLRLVAHIVKKYNQDEKNMEDMLSIGTIGLIKAINTFDENKGRRLATYAARCIENELLMMYRNEKKKSREVSLHEPIGIDREGNTISLFDVLESPEDNGSSAMELKEDILKVQELVDSVLTEKERDIINMRFGMNGNKIRTQREIGEMYGISRSYVSRIEKRAIEKLKKEFTVDDTNKK